MDSSPRRPDSGAGGTAPGHRRVDAALLAPSVRHRAARQRARALRRYSEANGPAAADAGPDRPGHARRRGGPGRAGGRRGCGIGRAGRGRSGSRGPGHRLRAVPGRAGQRAEPPRRGRSVGVGCRRALVLVDADQLDDPDCIDIRHALSWAMLGALRRRRDRHSAGTPLVVLACSKPSRHAPAGRAGRRAGRPSHPGPHARGRHPTESLVHAVRETAPAALVLWSQRPGQAGPHILQLLSPYPPRLSRPGPAGPGRRRRRAPGQPDSGAGRAGCRTPVPRGPLHLRHPAVTSVTFWCSLFLRVTSHTVTWPSLTEWTCLFVAFWPSRPRRLRSPPPW